MAHEQIAALLGGRSQARAISNHRGITAAKAAVPLRQAAFLQTVASTPLIAIDLLLVNGAQQVLLGHRHNAPARHYWFVPGGRIFKNESMDAAFRRISRAETGIEMNIQAAEFKGVYEHFYDDNFAGALGIDTHYVTLAYRMAVVPEKLRLPHEQHGAYRWYRIAELLATADVHPLAKAYFTHDDTPPCPST